MRGDNLVPLVQLLRSGVSKEELVDAFRLATSLRTPYWREDR